MAQPIRTPEGIAFTDNWMTVLIPNVTVPARRTAKTKRLFLVIIQKMSSEGMSDVTLGGGVVASPSEYPMAAETTNRINQTKEAKAVHRAIGTLHNCGGGR